MPGSASIHGYNPLAPTYMGLPDMPGSASLSGLTGGVNSLTSSSALSGLAGGFAGPSGSLLNSPPVSSVPSSIPYPQFSGKVHFPTSSADPYSNVSTQMIYLPQQRK
jgi:hypothetical protein